MINKEIRNRVGNLFLNGVNEKEISNLLGIKLGKNGFDKNSIKYNLHYFRSSQKLTGKPKSKEAIEKSRKTRILLYKKLSKEERIAKFSRKGNSNWEKIVRDPEFTKKRIESLKKTISKLSKKEFKKRYRFHGGNPAKRPDVKKKISEKAKGSNNPNWKPKITLICKSCGIKFKTIPSQKNRKKYCSKTCLSKNVSKLMKTKNPMKNLNVAKKVSKVKKEKFQDLDYKLKMLKLQQRHPNNFEEAFTLFCKRNNLPFEFVGDRAFWIGPCKSNKCRNPDFIHKNHKIRKAILISANYWYRDKKKLREQLEDYKDKNWNILLIWEKEFKNKQDNVLLKVKDFLGDKNALD